jgi:hypothetical protein
MGAEMIGLGALIIIVEARFARGARGPPGNKGAPREGNDGSADTVVTGVDEGVESGGVPPVALPPLGGARLETSLRGGRASFSLSLPSVADCVPRPRMLAFLPRDEKKPAEPDLTAADRDLGGADGGGCLYPTLPC